LSWSYFLSRHAPSFSMTDQLDGGTVATHLNSDAACTSFLCMTIQIQLRPARASPMDTIRWEGNISYSFRDTFVQRQTWFLLSQIYISWQNMNGLR
jgi:hypothetical protein